AMSRRREPDGGSPAPRATDHVNPRSRTRMPPRCDWAEGNDLLRHYHDTEWGVPLWDDRTLFEYMVLDAFQAGLSWAIILRKREGFRAAFHAFDPEAIARYGPRDVRRLLKDEGIIRNRQKIEATIGNA